MNKFNRESLSYITEAESELFTCYGDYNMWKCKFCDLISFSIFAMKDHIILTHERKIIEGIK